MLKKRWLRLVENTGHFNAARLVFSAIILLLFLLIMLIKHGDPWPFVIYHIGFGMGAVFGYRGASEAKTFSKALNATSAGLGVVWVANKFGLLNSMLFGPLVMLIVGAYIGASLFFYSDDMLFWD